MSLLDVRNLRVDFGAHTVVNGISFQVAAGEKLALVGESGSGKTITALSLLGLAAGARVQGQALLNGCDLLALSEAEQRGVRGGDVAMVFQEPMTALNPLMTVGDQIAEIFKEKRGLPLDVSRLSAIEMLSSTGLADPEAKARAYPHQLSGGQRQRAVIAMALASQPKLLLADEPTTALDVTLRGQMLDLLTDLQRRHGMAVLLITHDLQLVRTFADRVAVMERGHLVEQGAVAEVFARPQHAYTRLLLNSRPQRDPLAEPLRSAAVAATAMAAPVAAPVLQAQDLGVAYPVPLPGIRGWFKRGQSVALRHANFELQAGQTLAVVGESGSGKSTLALAVLNLLAFFGQVRVAGQAWAQQAHALREQRQRIQVVFQDPYSSLSPRLTVEQLVGEGLQVHEPTLTARQRQQRVVVALQEVGLLAQEAVPAPNHARHMTASPGANAPTHAPAHATNPSPAALALLARYPHQFSGGQRQRLAIARALVVRPQALVLDEPTSALDVTVQKQVLTLLQRLQRERGLSYLLITHDMDVVRAMAHHVMVLKAGEVVEHGSFDEVLNRPRHPYSRQLISAASD